MKKFILSLLLLTIGCTPKTAQEYRQLLKDDEILKEKVLIALDAKSITKLKLIKVLKNDENLSLVDIQKAIDEHNKLMISTKSKPLGTIALGVISILEIKHEKFFTLKKVSYGYNLGEIEKIILDKKKSD